MSERARRPYPSVGEPDRLDSIMRRGRSLRRRRQVGAAAGGVMGAVAVVAVAAAVLGGGSGADDQIVADDPTTTAAPTTTPTTTAPSPTSTMTVELLPGPPAQIRVDDPEQPDGATTAQCVTVGVYDPAAPPDSGALPVAYGSSCAPGISASGSADLAVVLSTDSESGTGQGAEVGTDLGTGSGPGVDIHCAASVTRPAPEDVAGSATRPGTTTFTVSAPDLEPGEYLVRVSAVSGIGDGCPPEQPGLEREHVVEHDGVLTLP